MGVSIYTSPNPEAFGEYDEEGDSVAIWRDQILQCSYSGFNRWRATLAEAIGTGTRAGSFGPDPDIDYSVFNEHNYQGEWEEGAEPEDPMYLLYVHSDCDGILPHRHLKRLADRLEETLPALSGYDFDRTRTFIEGLRQADRDGDGLIFT